MIINGIKYTGNDELPKKNDNGLAHELDKTNDDRKLLKRLSAAVNKHFILLMLVFSCLGATIAGTIIFHEMSKPTYFYSKPQKKLTAKEKRDAEFIKKCMEVSQKLYEKTGDKFFKVK